MATARIPKSVDFTIGENPKGGETRGLEIWLVLALHGLGLIGLARAQAVIRQINANPLGALPGQSLFASLQAEHDRSVLNDSLAGEDPDDLGHMRSAGEEFERLVEEFLARRAPAVDQPDGFGRDPLNPDVR